MIADELRRQADNFIELDELKDVLGRPTRDEDYIPEGAEAVAWKVPAQTDIGNTVLTWSD